MSSNEENLIFLLKNKKNKEVIYQHEIKLLEFQKEIIKNENISFYYAFKDMTAELEDGISLKMKTDGKNENIFLVKYSDKTLYEVVLDVIGLSKEDVEKNEVELYFIFEKLEKIFVNKIIEEHKNFILSNKEK